MRATATLFDNDIIQNIYTGDLYRVNRTRDFYGDAYCIELDPSTEEELGEEVLLSHRELSHYGVLRRDMKNVIAYLEDADDWSDQKSCDAFDELIKVCGLKIEDYETEDLDIDSNRLFNDIVKRLEQ